MSTKTIKDICTEYGLGQTDLARRFGIPIRTVQNWYAGVRIPPEYVVSMMDELLRIEGILEDKREKERDRIKKRQIAVKDKQE